MQVFEKKVVDAHVGWECDFCKIKIGSVDNYPRLIKITDCNLSSGYGFAKNNEFCSPKCLISFYREECDLQL